MLKSRFNLNFAIGILTNFNQWQVLWLPGDRCDDIARQAVQTFRPSYPLSTSHDHEHYIPKHGRDNAEGEVSGTDIEVESVEKCCRVCSGMHVVESGKDSKRVLLLIITTIYKMYETEVLTPAEISSLKVYFLLTEDSYCWVTCPWKKIEKPTLNYK